MKPSQNITKQTEQVTEKRPREGDPKYYYITSTGLIKCCIYDSRPINEQRRKFGNLFGTRAAAETALKRIKKALKGE